MRIQELIQEIRAMWDEWDLRDGEKDDILEFDAFYNGFMAPYFGCYRLVDFTEVDYWTTGLFIVTFDNNAISFTSTVFLGPCFT